MERLNGIASGVRHTQRITRQAHQRIVTQHITVLKVAGQPVQIDARTPTMIDEGDRVAVAGPLRDGVVQALAYRNLITGALGNAGLGASLVGMVFFLAASDAGAAVVLRAVLRVDPGLDGGGHVVRRGLVGMEGRAHPPGRAQPRRRFVTHP